MQVVSKGGLSRVSPIAHSMRVTTSAYGQAIPLVYGYTRISPRLIEATNFKSSTGNPKKGKGNITTYSIDVALLFGYGPMETWGNAWRNKDTYLGQLSSQTFTSVGPNTTFTFTVSNNTAPFDLIIGAIWRTTYSATYNDYGNVIGSQVFSGSTDIPLPNQNFPAPDNGDWQFSNQPYAKYNLTLHSKTVTIVFPSAQSNITVIVYYRESSSTTTQTNKESLGLSFNRSLYTEFSGANGTGIDLGSANSLPSFNFEAKGLYGMGQHGDCNPADVIIDLICSGNNIAYFGTTPVWNHGLGFSNYSVPVPAFFGVNPVYSRYGGILADEPNLWDPSIVGFGHNIGLNSVRAYCQANGIFISGVLDSQQPGAAVLKDLCDIANCAPWWDGAQLNFTPYSEVSIYGNGMSYVSPTATGPLFDLTARDFVPPDDKSAGLLAVRSRPGTNYNSLPIEFEDRSNQYNTNSVTIADSLDVTVQGQMPGSTRSLHWIKDSTTATAVGWALIRRSLLVGNRSYKFKLPACWGLLTPMDLVTLEDSSLYPFPIPVRITKISENEDWSLDVEAEPFIYGASSPASASTETATGGGGPPTNVDPGAVNAPIIFEATPFLSTEAEIWFGLSGSNQYYGGCSIWMSTDGGSSYKLVGRQLGKNTMGLVYSSNYPSHVDPDAVNTLHVDLTESLGTLASFTTTQRDLFQSLCYLEGGGTIVVNGVTLTIPYELVAYATATLATTNKYTLPPTIRRGVYSTPVAAHNIGAKFSFLLDNEIFKMALQDSLVGTTLHFKFTAFNVFGLEEQSLADAVDYTFAPTGLVGFGEVYTVTPVPTIYQGKAGGFTGILNADGSPHTATGWTDPTKLYFPFLAAHFQFGDLVYAARDAGLAVFTNTAGGEQAWVTIYDPTLVGEPGGTAVLTVFADLNQTRWNSPGYIRVGTIVSNQYASGGGGGTGGGGGSGGGVFVNDVVFFRGGGYSASEVLLRIAHVENVMIPAGATGSRATALIAPTGAVTFDVRKAGVSVGTVNFGAGATVGTFTFASDVTWIAGIDIMEIIAPVSPDATLAGVNITFRATRS